MYLDEEEAFARLMKELSGQFDQILIETPPGFGSAFSAAMKAADGTILVSTPDRPCLRDVRAVSDRLDQKPDLTQRLVINRLSEKMFSAMKLTVDDIMDRAGVPLLGILPEDRNVVLSAAFQKPLLKQTKKGAAAACKRIAKRLQGISVAVPKKI